MNLDDRFLIVKQFSHISVPFGTTILTIAEIEDRERTTPSFHMNHYASFYNKHFI